MTVRLRLEYAIFSQLSSSTRYLRCWKIIHTQLLSNEEESKPLHSREAAKEVLTARSFMEHHTELNPSLATRIIADSNSTLNREVFAREYLKALHSDSMSLLYRG